jgi:hypothetical protein
MKTNILDHLLYIVGRLQLVNHVGGTFIKYPPLKRKCNKHSSDDVAQ